MSAALQPTRPGVAPGRGSPTEALAGLVERVTFHNRDSGFCVLRVKARGQRDLVTLVGHAATIAAGEWVQMSGSWVSDRTHGLQFKFTFLKASPPTTLEGIERYLGSGMIRGIGPVYARKLVRAFGDAVFELIEQEPARLAETSRATNVHIGREPDHGWADSLAAAAALNAEHRERHRLLVGTIKLPAAFATVLQRGHQSLLAAHRRARRRVTG